MDMRPIPGFPGYAATADGRILSKKSRRPMAPKPDAYGYPSLTLRVDGRKICKCVHRLVALAWLGPPPSSTHEVAHGDGDKTNNAVSNLRWATPAENRADMFRHGTAVVGERHSCAKLTSAQVSSIRAARAAGVPRAQTAATYGVSYFTVAKIDTGKKRRHDGAAI